MKPVKKILALILAGVMALALLTGCGKATSLDLSLIHISEPTRPY